MGLPFALCLTVARVPRTHPIRREASHMAEFDLSELVYETETISDIIFKEGIMDLIRESSLFQSLTQQSREESFEQGREQGEKSREQGEKRSTIEAILDVLEIRFDLSEAHPLSTRIAAIDDLQRLKQLLRAAIQVPNIEAFQRVLDA